MPRDAPRALRHDAWASLDFVRHAPLLGLEDWVLHLATLSGTDGRGTGLAKSLSKGVVIACALQFLIVGVAAAAKKKCGRREDRCEGSLWADTALSVGRGATFIQSAAVQVCRLELGDLSRAQPLERELLGDRGARLADCRKLSGRRHRRRHPLDAAARRPEA